MSKIVKKILISFFVIINLILINKVYSKYCFNDSKIIGTINIQNVVEATNSVINKDDEIDVNNNEIQIFNLRKRGNKE